MLFPPTGGGEHLAFSLDDAPNPKPTVADKKGYGRLASLYTAFSTDFAQHALELCVSAGLTRILDPFAGMGTLGEAGRELPLQLTLNDLNPFATLSSLFRTSSSADILEATSRVRAIEMRSTNVSEKLDFLGVVAQEAGTDTVLFDLIRDANRPDRRIDALTIHLISLIRMASHKRLRGSNPTWTKRSKEEALDSEAVQAATQEVLLYAEHYARGLLPLNPEFSADCRCENVLRLNVEGGSVDAIVTSPPYPNRTDYIRHYLPAAELLLGGDEECEREIREAQFGTPLIRGSAPVDQLPASVADIIESVRSHKSYASERYYAKGFLYYFSDMKAAFSKFHTWLDRGGIILLVVQDAHYKEIRIPVADLLVDLAKDCGFEPQSRKDFRVPHTLSRLSPHSRASVLARDSFETALVLRKVSR